MQDELIAGDTLSYLATVANYPASAGWTAKFRLVPRAGGSAIVITATASDDAYLVQAGVAVTATWAAGAYSWSLWVEKVAERYTVQSGQITIRPDPATLTAGTDTRSPAERSLDAINAFLEGRASDAQLRYKINGRELERYPLADVLRLKGHFESAVAAERRAQGLTDPRGTARRILVRMP